MANTLTPVERHDWLEIYTAQPYATTQSLAANVTERVTVPTFTNAAGGTTNASRLVITANADLWVRGYASGDGDDIITNGAFAADTDWTKGAGWAIAAGVAAATTASAELTQSPTTLYEGRYYSVVFTVSGFSAGTVTASIGGTNGTARGSDATFTETILAGADADVAFITSSFTGNIDNVSVTPTIKVPASDLTTGYAPLLVPQYMGGIRGFYVGNTEYIDLVSASNSLVSMTWFRA